MTSFSGNQQTYEYHVVDNFEVRVENKRSTGCWSSSSTKLIQLCCIGTLLPIVWILIPVYAKLLSYATSTVPLGFTQMKMLDSNFSTFWCQGSNVTANVTFDAYLLDSEPATITKTYELTHHFELDDDLKEYWSVYLLKGSQLTIKSCSKYLGATVTLIKGESPLKKSCLAEDSSEEVSMEVGNATLNEILDERSSRPSHKRKDRNKQLVRITNVTTIGDSSASTPLEEEVEEVENGAFEEEDEVSKDKINSTKDVLGDMSFSDETSSSEETLLNCDDFVLSQPVVPDNNCKGSNAEHSIIKHTVEKDGYHTVVFSSSFEENGQGKNPVSAHFELLQNEFNITDAAASCHNTTECHFPVRFISSQRIFVTLTTPYDEENKINLASTFSIQSECIARTPIYVTFGLTLPFVLIICVFL